jgi:psp operon transcriptional activator
MLPSLALESQPIILVGEPGSGKSLIAEHIHEHRASTARSLAWLNFMLLSDRERRLGLFGAEPPELTTTKRSILEFPTTALLKHVDHAEPYLQEKLASSLAGMRFSRMGSTMLLPIKAQLIFTLRKSAEALEKAGRLHPALARTLTACRTITIPPLRARSGDIQQLARHLFEKFCREIPRDWPHRGYGVEGLIDPALVRWLCHQPYRDNVRDLMALIRGLPVFASPPDVEQNAKFEVIKLLMLIEAGREFSLPGALARIERRLLEDTAAAYGGHCSEVARRLGLTERNVRRKLQSPEC